ncbi:hypothetical protein WOLCODRAFT_131888 [Wolfiporia cocos MD-104 SS10]|uniref:F-box domain-containing protein n=1 Tax=Wolfiporia cocos (strain MD-104) TaxID=742152 RepID=A0A2H3JGU8_WOLCO|nr:hypothetical protein WOLCODRAFT_131888 [Wolfiporia cocos MD-104 SS10]
MSLSSLPAELIDAICEPLVGEAATLASLARSCIAVHPSATRMLYRVLSVSAFARNLPVVCTLAARPDLAQHVREFSITLDESGTVLRAFYAQLQNALRLMPQLASLELLVDSGASWVLPTFSDSAVLPRLEHLSCSFPLDTHVSDFLARAPALHSLHMLEPALPSTQTLPATHVPLLKSYTGPASLLPMLSSRPLTTIHLCGDLRIEDIPHSVGAPEVGEPEAGSESKFYPNLVPRNPGYDGDKPARANVQVLSAMTSAPPAPVLEALALAYPELVCLRLMTTYAFWETPDITLYTRIASTLASLRDLAVFELSGMHWEARPKAADPLSSKASSTEKEWVSPPVTPRAVDFLAEPEANADPQNLELGFGEAFLDWSY